LQGSVLASHGEAGIGYAGIELGMHDGVVLSEAQAYPSSMHVLGEAMTMAKLASASRVPWLRRTTSKQLHTGHGFAVARPKDKLMDMHSMNKLRVRCASQMQY
jgi:hypothetical protein